MSDWCPTKEQIEAYKLRQRQQRIDLYRRADDGPVTILMPPGAYIKPPPVPAVKRSSAMRRIWWVAVIVGAALLALPAIAQAPIRAVIDCGTLSGQGVVRVVIGENVLRVDVDCGKSI